MHRFARSLGWLAVIVVAVALVMASDLGYIT